MTLFGLALMAGGAWVLIRFRDELGLRNAGRLGPRRVPGRSRSQPANRAVGRVQIPPPEDGHASVR